MAVYDTEENGKSELTRKTLNCLYDTVDFDKHRIIIVDNNSCKETKKYLEHINLCIGFTIITLPSNIGTARAINKAWKLRRPGEHCIKMDNDVLIHSDNWADEMEQAIQRDPGIGIIGLKRKDLWQYPGHENEFYRSQLIMLDHKPGEDWVVVEATRDIMGTCTMFSSALLDKIGYLYQPGLYGFDDGLASHRSMIAGFVNCFLPHIRIDHIDPGGNDYQVWKEREAARLQSTYIDIVNDYISGKRSIYEECE